MIAKKAKPTTSSELEAKIASIDEVIETSRERIKTLTAAKDESMRAAYADGDAAAKARVDQARADLSAELVKLEDLAKLQTAMRDDLAAAKTRESDAETEKLEDELERVELQLPKLADAIVGAAAAIREHVSAYNVERSKAARLYARLVVLRGENIEPDDFGHKRRVPVPPYAPPVYLDVVALHVLETAGLPLPPHFGPDNADVAMAYRAGRAAAAAEPSDDDVGAKVRRARQEDADALERRVAPLRATR